MLSAYLRLMRFNKPIGILLLWYPTVWALWLATKGAPSIKIFCILLLGTILMRSAGCVMNDIADRRVDGWVSRTRQRPLVTGELSLQQAFCLLFVLLFAALLLVLLLPSSCFYYALIALFISGIYPFCKRFIHAPQCVLGIAFSLGIPMAFVATGEPITYEVAFLLILNLLWVISYDTIYAMVDKSDDLQIGIHSTAIYFGRYDRLIIALLQIVVQSLWLIWALEKHMSAYFYIFWTCALFIFLWQQWLIRTKKPKDCMRAFNSNAYYGALMWLGLMIV